MRQIHISKSNDRISPRRIRVSPRRIKPRFRWVFHPVWVIVALAAVFMLSGCGLTANNASSGAQSGTVVPTPTRDPSGFQAVASEACLVADWPTMQSNKPQGNLIAFQPKGADLAYLTPTDRTSWYVGALMLAKAPDYAQRLPLAPTALSAGDLTWSPAGSQLAFLAYRPSENLYTVMTVRPDGSGLTDLFPTDLARTDSRTSQKAIIGWKDENTLQVMASCGEECRQAYDIHLDAVKGQALKPTPVANYQDMSGILALKPHVPEATLEADKYPKNMRSLNWSPNNALVSYLDKRGFLWMLSIEEKVMYPIDIGLRDVYETQWTDDSRVLGIRAEDRIFVAEVPCRGNK